jgi:hypothetical protein
MFAPSVYCTVGHQYIEWDCYRDEEGNMQSPTNVQVWSPVMCGCNGNSIIMCCS